MAGCPAEHSAVFYLLLHFFAALDCRRLLQHVLCSCPLATCLQLDASLQQSLCSGLHQHGIMSVYQVSVASGPRRHQQHILQQSLQLTPKMLLCSRAGQSYQQTRWLRRLWRTSDSYH